MRSQRYKIRVIAPPTTALRLPLPIRQKAVRKYHNTAYLHLAIQKMEVL